MLERQSECGTYMGFEATLKADVVSAIDWWSAAKQEYEVPYYVLRTQQAQARVVWQPHPEF